MQTKPDYEAMEQQIINLFEQLPPDAQSDLLEELTGMTAPNEEADEATHYFSAVAHLAEMED